MLGVCVCVYVCVCLYVVRASVHACVDTCVCALACVDRHSYPPHPLPPNYQLIKLTFDACAGQMLDAAVTERVFQGLPLIGLWAGGEIGPVAIADMEGVCAR